MTAPRPADIRSGDLFGHTVAGGHSGAISETTRPVTFMQPDAVDALPM